MKAHNLLKLIFSVVVCEFAGMLGAVFTAPSVSGWYAQLVQPSFVVPNWLFGVVWPILYLLMGIAAFIVWNQRKTCKHVKLALGIFGVQLILNSLWSIIFFGMHNPGAALVEIVMLWFSILATIIAFYRVSKHTLWLLLPYILWVSFAVYLNYSIYILN
ncbi:MAG: TspO/MBR family protein [bacterium]|nr:TspO/MBR family protein [bacterium]